MCQTCFQMTGPVMKSEKDLTHQARRGNSVSPKPKKCYYNNKMGQPQQENSRDRKTPSPKHHLQVTTKQNRQSPTHSAKVKGNGGHRSSPSKPIPIPVAIPGDFNYAGPKFSDPPSPKVLPKPPSHWVSAAMSFDLENKDPSQMPYFQSSAISSQLKMLLNVKA